jgi:hypothetical protein
MLWHHSSKIPRGQTHRPRSPPVYSLLGSSHTFAVIKVFGSSQQHHEAARQLQGTLHLVKIPHFLRLRQSFLDSQYL